MRTISATTFQNPAGKFDLSKYKNCIKIREIQYRAIKPVVSVASVELLVSSLKSNKESKPKDKFIAKMYPA